LTRTGLIKFKTLFATQGALQVILGLMGIVAGESVSADWGIKLTSDRPTLNRGFAMSTLALDAIRLRISTWVGSKLRESAFIGGKIDSAFGVNLSYDMYAGATRGSGATVNLVLKNNFAILLFSMGARQKTN